MLSTLNLSRKCPDRLVQWIPDPIELTGKINHQIHLLSVSLGELFAFILPFKGYEPK